MPIFIRVVDSERLIVRTYLLLTFISFLFPFLLNLSLTIRSYRNWYGGQFSMIYLTIFFNYNNINHIGHSHFVLTWFGKCIYMSLTIRYFEKTHGWQKHIFSNNLEKQIQIWQNHVFPENFIYFPPVELKNWIIIYAGLRLSKSWHCIFFGHFGCNSCKLYGQRVWYQTCYLF